MKKKNLISFIVFIILIFLFSVFLYFYYSLYSSEKREYLRDIEELPPPTKREYLTNIEELRSLFTDYMKDEVDYGLKLLACEPTEYYYDNSNFCFVCEKAHACFGFAWVQRTGGERMNPKGKIYLTNYDKLSVKVADFYQNGLASLFECQEENNNSLFCQDSIIFVEEYKDVKIVLTDQKNLENVSKKICAYFGNPSPNCREEHCSCGDKDIFFTKDQLFIYGAAL